MSKNDLEMGFEALRNGEFILDPGEVQFKQMCISKPENEVTEWSEF